MEFARYFAITVFAVLAAVWVEQVWLAALLLLAFAAYAIHAGGKRGVRASKGVARELASGIPEGLAEAEGNNAPGTVLVESVREAGHRLGEQAFASDAHRFTMKPWAKKMGKGAQSVLEKIRNLFG